MENKTKKILIFDADYDIGEDNTALMIKEGFSKKIEIVRVCDNEFPISMDYDGFVISGSAASFDDNKKWIRKLTSLIKQIHEKNLPLLGICFGHQIIAHALGGKVEHSHIGEIGYYPIHLTENGKNETLFSGINNPFVCFQYHNDIVTKLPDNAQLLAINQCCIQAYKIKNTYGVQFHPEITPELAVRIAKKEKRNIREMKLDAEEYGGQLLQLFANFEKNI